MPTRAREVLEEKGPTRAEQIARIRAAMTYKGITKKDLATRMKASRNTITAHLKPGKRAIAPYYARRYEDALGLPRLALDSGSPAEITALLQSGVPRASLPQPALFPRGEGDVASTVGFIRGQLEGFRRQGRTVVPVTQVEVWLAELEAVGTTSPPAAEPAATTSIERVESLKQVEREAAAPSQTPRGRAG